MADNDTDPQLSAVKLPAPSKETIEDIGLQGVPVKVVVFANQIEELMNVAYQQSQVDGQHWADWCNALGDLWREVKRYA